MDDYVFGTCKSGSGHMTEANALDFVKKGAKAVGIISGAFNGLKENVINVSYDRVMEIIKGLMRILARMMQIKMIEYMRTICRHSKSCWKELFMIFVTGRYAW